MITLVRKATLLTACGLIIAASALATTSGVPNPAYCTFPCAIVLVGNNVTDTAADPYGLFTVVVSDGNSPVMNSVVKIDFSGCCPDIKLSNTQLGVGVVHTPNAAFVTGTTDNTGTATFVIEGAASQGAGPVTGYVCSLPTCGCATVTATPSGGGTPVTLSSAVFVSTPDENGAVGTTGVDATDLSVFVFDKNAYFKDPTVYRQRSDFDFHLPAFNCSAVFAQSFGLGDNVGDLPEWVRIKNAATSIHNGPFPVTCP